MPFGKGTEIATDYRGILTQVVAFIAADTTITDLLVARTIAGASSKANSVFYGDMIQPMLFPCISIRAFGPSALFRNLHENPHKIAVTDVELSIFGDEAAVWDIQAEVDERMESANIAGALTDSADWAFKDVDVSGNWVNIDVPREIRKDSVGQNLVQRVKTYTVVAADKN